MFISRARTFCRSGASLRVLATPACGRARSSMVVVRAAAHIRPAHSRYLHINNRIKPQIRATVRPTAAAATIEACEVPVPALSFANRPGIWDSQGRLQLKNLTFEELQEWCESIGHDSHRARQLWRAMYADKHWVRSLEGAGASGQPFAAAFKSAVGQAGSLTGGLTLQSASTARDGTHKLVFALQQGGEGAPGGNVETVLIPMRNRDGSQLRYTACLSSQVGCAMNCQFCYTGRMGLLGNLSAAQMVEQLVEARRWLAHYTQQQQQQQLPQQQQQQHFPQQQQQQQQQQQTEQGLPPHGAAEASRSSSSRSSSKRARGGSWTPPPPRINNIVFMGMGEPLHNMSALLPALDIICHPAGLGLSRSKVIVSTVGLVPQLRQLRASGKAKLAVSLHATTDEVRSWIVPTNRKYPLAELIGALRELYPLPAATKAKQNSSRSRNSSDLEAGSSSSSSSSDGPEPSSSSSIRSDDFVVIEYVLLKDVNDTDDDAYRLLELLADVYCMINFIVFNPHEGTRFEQSDEQQVKRFRQILMDGGKVCTLRMSKGDDEMAACGQLGNPQAVSRPAPLLKPPTKLQEKLPGAAAVAAAAAQQRLLLQAQQQSNAGLAPSL